MPVGCAGPTSCCAVYPALSVLVVACPCALILATPAAIIAALGRLAGTGILIKGGAALERLASVNAFAFDKTGTLTEGRLELAEIVALEGETEDSVLRAAASAEQRSEHLLAQLIVHSAASRGLSYEPAHEFLALPGSGVEAAVGEHRIRVGNRRLMEEAGGALTGEIVGHLERLDASGCTSMIVSRDGTPIGIVAAPRSVAARGTGHPCRFAQLGHRIDGDAYRRPTSAGATNCRPSRFDGRSRRVDPTGQSRLSPGMASLAPCRLRWRRHQRCPRWRGPMSVSPWPKPAAT